MCPSCGYHTPAYSRLSNRESTPQSAAIRVYVDGYFRRHQHLALQVPDRSKSEREIAKHHLVQLAERGDRSRVARHGSKAAYVHRNWQRNHRRIVEANRQIAQLAADALSGGFQESLLARPTSEELRKWVFL